MRRRDFTVNAMARRLETGELVDPLDGRADLEARRLRTVSPQSFREDPLRLVRALRFVSQLGFEPDEELLAQMREEAPAVKLVSGERIGGGLAADGMGELSKLLLGAEPARALRLARDTGVLVELLPEFGPAIGFDQESRYHDLTVDEHMFAVVQAAADAGLLPGRAARRALPRPRQADRRLARATTGGSTTTRSPASPRTGTTGRRRPRGRGAAPAPVSERAPAARRPDRAPPHVPAREGRRPRARGASCAATATSSRSTSSTTSTPTCSASAAATASRRRWRRSSGSRASVRWWSRSVEPAPAARPRGRRQRPDRARLQAGAAARAHPPRAPRRGRRRAGAQHARRAARAGEGAPVIRWEVDGYEVAFTTRVGGVSEGPYASLNLGRKSGDDVERVDENRRIACDAIGADLEKLALNYQVHSARVLRAAPGDARRARGRALDRRARPADPRDVRRLPADRARARRHGRAGRRRSPRRLARAARRHRRGRASRRSAAARSRPRSGRAIGPCCYEVGEEVAAPFRERFGDDVVRERPSRPLDERRARAPRSGRRARRPLRPLHGLRAGDVLLAPPRPRRHRPPGGDRLRRRLRSASATSASARRSARRSRSSPRRSTSRSRTWPRSPRPASRSSARTAPRTSRRSTPPTATPSAGTSSATCRAARRRS